jgi:hypothetical protein
MKEYFNLDDILKLDIPQSLKIEFGNDFNKLVYFDYCGKIGILRGYRDDNSYIINYNIDYYIPTTKVLHYVFDIITKGTDAYFL